MPDRGFTTCKSCGAEILWIITPAGKSMPLDAKGESLWQLEPDTLMSARLVVVRKSHFATCPNADAHRKPKEAA